MSLLNSTGFSVVSLAEAGIKTPKDLEGKKVAVSPGDPLGQLFQARVQGQQARLREDHAWCRSIRPPRSSRCSRSSVDALLGGADDQYFLIKYKGGRRRPRCATPTTAPTSSA